jgi:hypothetical protein
MNAWVILAGIAFVALAYVLIPVAAAAREHFRRQKLVRCPVIDLGAGVLVSRAGLAEALGCRSLRRVSECTFWPRHKGCAQQCLAVPDDELRDFQVPTAGR